MKLNNYPAIFLDALHSLTATGRAQVYANEIFSDMFDTRFGSGQGDPASCKRYNIGTEPLIRAFDIVTIPFQYVFETGIRLAVSAFADDDTAGLNLAEASQLDVIIEVYDDFHKVSGLQMNVGKTEIMCLNTPPDLIADIQSRNDIKVVTGIKHLGLQLRPTYKASCADFFAAVGTRATTKYVRIHSTPSELFHRRQLIQTAYLSSFTHIFLHLVSQLNRLT